MSKIRKKALAVDPGAAFTRLEIRLLGAAVVGAAAISLVLSLAGNASDDLAGLGAPAGPAATAAGR